MNKTALLCVTGFVLSCHRQVPVEYLPLSPSGAAEKWWIINAVSTDAANRQIHQSLLLTLNLSGEKTFAAGYASCWTSGDEQARSGIRQTNTPIWGASGKSPFFCILPDTDSTGLDWNWALGIHRSQFQAFLKDGESEFQFKSRLRLDAPDLLPIQVLPAESVVSSACPARFFEKSITPERIKSEGMLHISTIEQGQRLLGLVQNGRVVWLDTNCGAMYRTLLLYVEQSGHCKVLASAAWNQNGEYLPELNNPVVVQKISFWESPESGKSYPLFWEMTDTMASQRWIIHPALDDQEIRANKNSLWMGAVKISDAATGKVAGYGNMIIL